MHPNYYFSPLVIALAIGLAAPAKAAVPLSLHKTAFAQVQQKFQMSLPGAAKALSVSENSLQFVSEHTDKKRVTHIRMQQNYDGFPVFGGYAIMHSANSAKTLATAKSGVRMSGLVYENLQAELGKPKSYYVTNSTAALAQFKAKYSNNDVSEERVTPLIYIDKKHQAHWAYKVSVFVRPSDTIPQRPTAILDAETYQTFVQWDDVKTKLVPAKGMGFGGNHKTGFYRYGIDLPLLEISRDPKTQICLMETVGVKVIDMEHEYAPINKPMTFYCPKAQDNETNMFSTGYDFDGYDKNNGAASPSNDALYAGYVITHMYKDWYDEAVLTNEDGFPMQLVMRVHYGDGYENAYWDGRQMTFGDGENMMYPLVSLGVAGHEISHGFTEQHSNLEYLGQSGGMNEAFSDMAAQAAEYYSSGKNSWQIGPEIMKEDSGYEALRYMDLPSKDGESIDTADAYTDDLDVHYSSGVFNHLFYILAHKPNWNVHKAFDVMVKANLDYWTPYASFEEGGCGLISAAQDLEYPIKDVHDSLSEVAIDFSSCNSTSN